MEKEKSYSEVYFDLKKFYKKEFGYKKTFQFFIKSLIKPEEIILDKILANLFRFFLYCFFIVFIFFFNKMDWFIKSFICYLILGASFLIRIIKLDKLKQNNIFINQNNKKEKIEEFLLENSFFNIQHIDMFIDDISNDNRESISEMKKSVFVFQIL